MTVNILYLIHWLIAQNKDGADYEEDHHEREQGWRSKVSTLLSQDDNHRMSRSEVTYEDYVDSHWRYTVIIVKAHALLRIWLHFLARKLAAIGFTRYPPVT